MPNWGRPDALDKVKAENGEFYNFTLHKYGMGNEIEKGYILVKDPNHKWHRISGFKNSKTKEFEADYRGKWAHLVTPHLDPPENLEVSPKPNLEDYKVERLGPPVGFAPSPKVAEDVFAELERKYGPAPTD